MRPVILTLAITAALLAAILGLAGCATPLDPRDPAIYRPTTPASYPLPY